MFCRQKWLHVQSLSLLLEHDVPLGRHLNVPSPSSKYQQVTCRQALLTVTDMLNHYCSFILLENHTYVKLVAQ